MLSAFIVRQQCLLIKKPYQSWRGGWGGSLCRMFQLYFSSINKNELRELSLTPHFYVLSLDHQGNLYLAVRSLERKFNYNIWFLHPCTTLYPWMCCLQKARELVCKKMRLLKFIWNQVNISNPKGQLLSWLPHHFSAKDRITQAIKTLGGDCICWEAVWLVQDAGKSLISFLICTIEELYSHQHLGHSCNEVLRFVGMSMRNPVSGPMADKVTAGGVSDLGEQLSTPSPTMESMPAATAHGRSLCPKKHESLWSPETEAGRTDQAEEWPPPSCQAEA